MKLAVITGACGGLGKAFCEVCAQRKYNLFLTGTNEFRLQQLKDELSLKYSVEIETYVCDLSQIDQTKELCDKCRQMEISLLVNNAGSGKYGDFMSYDMQCYADMNQVNMTSLMMLNHAAIEQMKLKGGGILNVASTASFQPGPMMANYYATKAYVLSLSEALSLEYEKTPVHICALCCGPMETGFAQHANLKHTWIQRWMMVSPVTAAAAGLDGLKYKRTRVIVGKMNRIMIGLSRFVPHGILLKVMRFAQSKRQL